MPPAIVPAPCTLQLWQAFCSPKGRQLAGPGPPNLERRPITETSAALTQNREAPLGWALAERANSEEAAKLEATVPLETEGYEPFEALFLGGVCPLSSGKWDHQGTQEKYCLRGVRGLQGDAKRACLEDKPALWAKTLQS